MFKVLDYIKDDLPKEKPHYLMGVTPSDILGLLKEVLICLTVYCLQDPVGQV